MAADDLDVDEVVFHSRHLGINMSARNAKIERAVFRPQLSQITENDSDEGSEIPMTELNGNECAKHFKTNEEMKSDFPLMKRNTDSDDNNREPHQNDPANNQLKENDDPVDSDDEITFDFQGPQQVFDDLDDTRHNEVQELVLNYFLMHLPQHLIWRLTF